MADLLVPQAIRLSQTAVDRDDAIRQCGLLLVELGAVDPSYVDSMLAREQSISTYIGEGVAIPHGVTRDLVRHDALAVLQFPDGIDWGGVVVNLCIAIAARGDGHVEILGELAQVLMDPLRAKALREAVSPDIVMELLT